VVTKKSFAFSMAKKGRPFESWGQLRTVLEPIQGQTVARWVPEFNILQTEKPTNRPWENAFAAIHRKGQSKVDGLTMM
jgi:hypothetical protein